MSLLSLFQTGRRSLRVLEAAIQTAGHNIANAGTAGYSRQRLGLRADSLVTQGLHITAPRGAFAGSGVSVQSFERIRDGLLDAAARDAWADLGAANEEVRLGSALEGAFAVGTPGSLTESLSSFWNAWADAADNPTDLGVRTVLQQRAASLATTFQRLDSNLTELTGQTREALADGVGEVNALTSQIAALNERISAARASGTPDFAAEDARDQAVQALAAFMPVRVQPGDDGAYTVTVQGMAVVQGTEALALQHTGPPDAATDTVQFGGTNVAFKPGDEGGGRLGGWLRTINTHLPETRASLDALAAQLVADVNAAHAGGYGLDGGTGRSFFDPAGTTAASLALSADVDDPAAIALAGAPDAPGDASVALALADLRGAFEEGAAGITASVGQRLQRASAGALAADALVGHFEAMQAGVSGVSIDEEMTRLIEYQQAYAASARVLTTAQSMFDTLLTL
ncbi:MAG: flagellar hook-associated protein FlgK [Rhodothermaceae bacterium]|nr:flagellar hook-associated protein FlgK [Rhodothermaceae bacterium]